MTENADTVMLRKISRSACIQEFPVLPLREYDNASDDFSFHWPSVYSNHVLEVPSKKFSELARRLGTETRKLAGFLGVDMLVFLGDENTPWLKRDQAYKPAQRGLDYLAANKIGKRFNGGIVVGQAALPAFVAHLAWMVRCNAVLPYIHFTDPAQRFVGTLCQYGNLHLYPTTHASDELLKGVMDKTHFCLLYRQQMF